MSDRATMRALYKKHGIIFVEEEQPDHPVLREGSRISFTGRTMKSTRSSLGTGDSHGFLNDKNRSPKEGSKEDDQQDGE